ncbi:sensor histidine kinase [Brevibacillus daliensis]|uniref:sensor histidine kinase n=1 Tax=Brevibacillus daliensis TaxID=2892995 RepID=UPI001E4C2436|nr:HAMP domain-containing sensor histidine kinase [Brevibacillus daliensis]
MYGIKKRLVMNFTLVVFLVVLVSGSTFVISMRGFYYGGAEQALTNRVQVATTFYNKYIQYYNLHDKAKYIFEHISQDDTAHIEVIDLEGNVIIDFNGFTDRQIVKTKDVTDALEGNTGTWIGRNPETGERVLAVSDSLTYSGTNAGVLRYITSIEEVDTVVKKITLFTVLIGSSLVLFSLVINHWLAKRLISPVLELTDVAQHMAKGDFSHRALLKSDDEIGTLGEAFNYMAGELEKTEEMKNDFISSVSHELRTPLTSIKGWSELVLTGDMEDKDEMKMAMQIILKESDRLTGLVEQLLDFSRLQSGRMEIQKAELDINTLLAEIKQQFSARAGQKNIKLILETAEEPLIMWGDENKLKQVIINLLHNSLKFSEENTAITLRSMREEDELILQVEDQGLGIHEEDIPRVTDRFYKGKHKQSGSGIGLSLCLEIVKLHQGRLDVQSEVDKGTLMIIHLPIGEKESY